MTYSKWQYVSPGTNTQETDIKVRELKSKYRKVATSIALRMKKDFQAFSWFMSDGQTYQKSMVTKSWSDFTSSFFIFSFFCLFFNS